MYAATSLSTILALLAVSLHHSDAQMMGRSSRAVTNTSKAGLGWPNGNSVDVTQYQTTGKVSWYYTWSPYPINTDLEFVPMLWGQSAGQFSATINQTISNRHVTAVLGMNEPQEVSQANLSPEDGANIWKTYLEPLHAQGIRLGSPAMSSAPSGMPWMKAFFAACAGGCTVDFIAVHWYDINATAFIQYLQDYHSTFQRPLWVTEWACQNNNDPKAQCSQSDVSSFLNVTQGFMDSSEFVERYAWFGAMTNMQGLNQNNALMDKNGKINDLGKQYIGSHPGSSNDGGSVTLNAFKLFHWMAPTTILSSVTMLTWIIL